jgi:two-component system response regulator PilR (NtrC family)
VKGSFTGALYNKEGLFEVADKGSIFLDEIGEMPLSLQSKLLRVLENGTFRRVGGLNDITVDVRVISATNKDISEAVNQGASGRPLLPAECCAGTHTAIKRTS